MWELRLSSKFKKDLKHYRNQPEKLAVLKVALGQLQEKRTVDVAFKPHMLAGEYKGCMECHIQNDFLLIWLDKNGKDHCPGPTRISFRIV